MQTVTLNRFEKTDQGTVGAMAIPALGFSCFAIELPWRDNKKGLSCIPTGEYSVRIRQSPRYGTIFHVTGVDGRSYILIHGGNYAGDIEKGFKTHSKGCILLGKSLGFLQKQRAVLNSRITLRKFMNLLENKPFKLIIS